MIHTSDLELAQRALAREPDALRSFAERVACVAPFLRRRAQRTGMRLPRSTLDDISQETYLALWRKLALYRGESRLETWACGFAFHELRRWQEAALRRSGSPLDHLEEPSFEPLPPDETEELVERALDRLGPPTEEVIRLKHFEDLTFESIGLRLDLSPNTAKSHYYRGLVRLRSWLSHAERGYA